MLRRAYDPIIYPLVVVVLVINVEQQQTTEEKQANEPCKDCTNKIGLMFNEYEIRGIHYYSNNDFCCESAREWIIPLTGLERI